ncbi:hypothetical protein GCM10008929_20200 [Alkalibacterium psychrotolerans]
MTEEEKAKLILEGLEEYIQIDYAFEKYYMLGIKKGLKKIDQQEKDKEKSL